MIVVWGALRHLQILTLETVHRSMTENHLRLNLHRAKLWPNAPTKPQATRRVGLGLAGGQNSPAC